MMRHLKSLLMLLGCIVASCQLYSGDQTDAQLYSAVAQQLHSCKFSASETRILTSVFSNKRFRESGLSTAIIGQSRLMRLVWSHSEPKIGSIFIFDTPPIVPQSDFALPMIVVIERENEIVSWQYVASFSSGFISADFDGNLLHIVSRANWIHRNNEHYYKLDAQHLSKISSKVVSPSGKIMLSPTESDPKCLALLLEEIRRTDDWPRKVRKTIIGVGRETGKETGQNY